MGLLATAQGEPSRLTVLISDDGAAYHDFAQAFSIEAGKQNLLTSIVAADSPVPQTDMVIAVGGKAAAAALKSHPVVLCVLVSRSAFEKLLQESPVPRNARGVSAIYLDQPFKRQISLINAALPSTRNIGILFSEPSADIVNLRKVIADSHFTLREQRIHSADSLHYDLQSLLQSSDVLLAIPDIQIYNPTTMRNILLSTYRANVPLIGISPAYVRAGALCAVYSTPGQIAVQAAYMSRQYAETAKLPPPQYPAEYEVSVNQQVARSLGLQIMDGAVIVKQMKADSASWGGK